MLLMGIPSWNDTMKITDDDNKELPWDGKTFGRLKVRGPAVAKGYYGGAGADQFDADGWFDTGDVATIDPQGYMQITDRAKDVIKSGGEWISSIDLENLAVGHPDVAEAAVIGADDKTTQLCMMQLLGPATLASTQFVDLTHQLKAMAVIDEVVYEDEESVETVKLCRSMMHCEAWSWTV